MDDGEPPLGDSTTFHIRVNEVNQPPALFAITDQRVEEMTELIVKVSAADSDIPRQSLSFGLASGAPDGATISPDGVFRWTPTEAQGPGDFTATIRAPDDGTPSFSTETRFVISVLETTTAPVLEQIPDYETEPGSELVFIATASDSDLPANALLFNFAGEVPVGATFSAAGEFAWTPLPGQAETSYSMTISVKHDGSPPLETRRSFTIVVLEAHPAPRLTAMRMKPEGHLQLSCATRPGDRLVLQSILHLGDSAWNDLGQELVATDNTVEFTVPIDLSSQRFFRVLLW